MIQLQKLSLPSATQNQLDTYQAEVDQTPNYATQVKEAKKLFKRYNTKSNKTFQTVKDTLTQLCSGACRCCYCEDSCADEVEHFRPKNLYPEKVFVWENYLYACGGCNRRKSDKFAVFEPKTGRIIEINRPRNARVVPPAPGELVLIDPRSENPLDYLELDLIDTFFFRPSAKEGTRKYYRADYTIETLGLNRDVLWMTREGAFGDYERCLYKYANEITKGTPREGLQYLKESIQKMHHPTVWAEIKRQREYHQELKELFAKVPEALGW